jgi:hypothetical protein
MEAMLAPGEHLYEAARCGQPNSLTSGEWAAYAKLDNSHESKASWRTKRNINICIFSFIEVRSQSSIILRLFDLSEGLTEVGLLKNRELSLYVGLFS